ncbi:NADP oxidoreductase [bacterium]|nr:NADP oxidoreductase [bacterium]
MRKLKLATVWLDGCSGCHMSLLDTDERIVTLLQHVDIVYSPLVDAKVFPDDVDIALIEGAVSTDEDVVKLKKVRSRTKILIALGDCAVTGNVPAMRNTCGAGPCLNRAYKELAELHPQIPSESLPRLLDKVIPIHETVAVDLHIPGCPPPADAIFHALYELVLRKQPDVKHLTRFGR